jgi:hypothetical protein
VSLTQLFRLPHSKCSICPTPTKPYMKCILATSWFEYIVSETCNHHTVNTQLMYASPNKICKLPKIASDWYHDYFNVVNDGNHLQEFWNAVYHTAVLERLSSETMHFCTYVYINYFCYLRMRNSFMKSCVYFWKTVYLPPGSHLISTPWISTHVVLNVSLYTCRIWCSHSGSYECCHLLEYDAA